MTTTGKNRIMIYGPKDDGTYIVEFRTAAGATSRSACLMGCLCRTFREEHLARLMSRCHSIHIPKHQSGKADRSADA